MKPDRVKEATWQLVVGTFSVAEILFVGRIAEANRDEVERLVRVARGSNDNQQQAVRRRRFKKMIPSFSKRTTPQSCVDSVDMPVFDPK